VGSKPFAAKYRIAALAKTEYLALSFFAALVNIEYASGSSATEVVVESLASFVRLAGRDTIVGSSINDIIAYLLKINILSY
jgi:hypothetical protein